MQTGETISNTIGTSSALPAVAHPRQQTGVHNISNNNNMNYYLLPLVAAATLLAGCAPFRYSQFTGHQSWPTVPGTMADKGYAVPVYLGWPEKPYTVLGSIQFANPNATWDDGDTARAARLAKSKKGDALVMRVGAESGVGAIAGAAADPKVFSMWQVAAFVIKWRPENEIASESEALQRFEATFKAKHPQFTLSAPLLTLGAELLNSQGLRLDSEAVAGKLNELLTEVLQPSADGKSAKWLFKGALRSNALASSYTQVAYGVATVTQTGENITIVSAPGRIGIHLSGMVKEGRLSGQMGVTSGDAMYSGKAEGVFSADQISVSGQAQTADGLLQANFPFLH